MLELPKIRGKITVKLYLFFKAINFIHYKIRQKQSIHAVVAEIGRLYISKIFEALNHLIILIMRNKIINENLKIIKRSKILVACTA